jgi:hypothetical protein
LGFDEFAIRDLKATNSSKRIENHAEYTARHTLCIKDGKNWKRAEPTGRLLARFGYPTFQVSECVGKKAMFSSLGKLNC